MEAPHAKDGSLLSTMQQTRILSYSSSSPRGCRLPSSTNRPTKSLICFQAGAESPSLVPKLALPLLRMTWPWTQTKGNVPMGMEAPRQTEDTDPIWIGMATVVSCHSVEMLEPSLPAYPAAPHPSIHSGTAPSAEACGGLTDPVSLRRGTGLCGDGMFVLGGHQCWHKPKKSPGAGWK